MTEISMIPEDLKKRFSEKKPGKDGSLPASEGLMGAHLHRTMATLNVETNKDLSIRMHERPTENDRFKEVSRIQLDERYLKPMFELQFEHAIRGLGRTTIQRLITVVGLRFFPDELLNYRTKTDKEYFKRRDQMPQMTFDLVMGNK